MTRRLFWKICLGFWAVYLMLAAGMGLYWTVRPADPYLEWDPPHAAGIAMVEGAAGALRREGPAGFNRHVADWPASYRERLNAVPLPRDRCALTRDAREIAMRIDAGSSGWWCLRYHTPPLPDAGSWSDFLLPSDYLVGLALAGLLFSGALALYVTRPIHLLRRGFDRLARGDLQVRLGNGMGRRRDEIADLAHDFDGMAERLQELVGARDRLLHDVSHELRSPLARMRLAADLLRRDPTRLESSLDRIDREAAHLDRLVGELLTLARLESDAGDNEEYFDLLDILRLVIEDAAFEAEVQAIRIDADLPTQASENEWLVLGSGQLVHRAVENIVRNALRFSSAGQTIRLALRKADPSQSVVTIDDQGPGINDSEAARLLEPFVQGARQVGTGFGLGLGIARRAIVAVGGSVSLANRTEGGLRVTIALPRADVR